MIFIDTSAILAVLNVEDQYHISARDTWQKILSQEIELVCTNYILIETIGILQHRFGMEAVRLFQSDIAPILVTYWVDQELHNRSISALLAANQRQISLVDCVSFEVMRHLDISQVFCFDPHFQLYGFEAIPSPL